MAMKQMLAGSALALGAAFASATAHADSVNIHTGSVDWHVNGVSAVVVDPADQPTGYWIAESLVGDGAANWISVPGGEPAPYQTPGIYQYTLDLASLEIEAGLYRIDGFYTSDNLVTEIAIGDQIVFSIPQPGANEDPLQYKESVAFVWTGDLVGNEILTFTVYNEQVNLPTNETGFLFAGQISAVPSPAAFGAGLAMLGGLVLRRRRQA